MATTFEKRTIVNKKIFINSRLAARLKIYKNFSSREDAEHVEATRGP